MRFGNHAVRTLLGSLTGFDSDISSLGDSFPQQGRSIINQFECALCDFIFRIGFGLRGRFRSRFSGRSFFLRSRLFGFGGCAHKIQTLSESPVLAKLRLIGKKQWKSFHNINHRDFYPTCGNLTDIDERNKMDLHEKHDSCIRSWIGFGGCSHILDSAATTDPGYRRSATGTGCPGRRYCKPRSPVANHGECRKS